MGKGIVYLIGAGPGDPGLFTLKGKRLLEESEAVVYDRLVNGKILSYAPPEAELIYVGKASSHHSMHQGEINQLLVRKALEGKKVVRLKGGDPFVFGRGGEEALYLREHGVDYEIVPGITSAIASPAYAGIPVTHRDVASSLAIITGHEKPGKQTSSIKWQELAQGIDTLVFLMGIENLDHIVKNLLKYGKNPDTPVALVRWGTLPGQQVLQGTLADIDQKVRKNKFMPPAVIIVGEVVKLRKHLHWWEDKPLWGKRIVVTRSRRQASILADKIIELGGEVLEFPTIEITRKQDLTELYRAFKTIDSYQWIVFTSVNAVNIFFKEMFAGGFDIRNLNNIKICAIGPATEGSLARYGIRADIVPDEFMAESLAEELGPRIKKGQKILLPRAYGARKFLPETLAQMGAVVDEIHLYKAAGVAHVNEKKRQMILTNQVDLITFTSSSTVINFINIMGRENIKRIKARIGCIGPITAKTAQDNGLTVDITAGEYTVKGLVAAIAGYFIEPGEDKK